MSGPTIQELSAEIRELRERLDGPPPTPPAPPSTLERERALTNRSLLAGEFMCRDLCPPEDPRLARWSARVPYSRLADWRVVQGDLRATHGGDEVLIDPAETDAEVYAAALAVARLNR